MFLALESQKLELNFTNIAIQTGNKCTSTTSIPQNISDSAKAYTPAGCVEN